MSRFHRFGYCVFFFFSSRRRHTRCSRDWSSDVCSSDLLLLLPLRGQNTSCDFQQQEAGVTPEARRDRAAILRRDGRSEERRVGKEGRSRWAPDHLKKKKKNIKT